MSCLRLRDLHLRWDSVNWEDADRPDGGGGRRGEGWDASVARGRRFGARRGRSSPGRVGGVVSSGAARSVQRCSLRDGGCSRRRRGRGGQVSVRGRVAARGRAQRARAGRRRRFGDWGERVRRECDEVRCRPGALCERGLGGARGRAVGRGDRHGGRRENDGLATFRGGSSIRSGARRLGKRLRRQRTRQVVAYGRAVLGIVREIWCGCSRGERGGGLLSGDGSLQNTREVTPDWDVELWDV